MNEAFLKLVQRGATVEVTDAVEADPSLAQYRDPQGVSALVWAVYAGQSLVRDFLLQKLAAQGVSLDVFEAASVGEVAHLKAILDAEPEAVSAFSTDGWTALHLASAFGAPASVALLLAHGARVDVIARNAQRNQPLHAALALGRNPESIRILLAHGANANAAQAGGFTPIFSATAANRRDLVELLLAHGANPHHASDQGKTPADFARERGHAEMAEWLERLPSK